MSTFAAICSSVSASSASSCAALARLAVRRKVSTFVNWRSLSSGIKKTAPTEAGAVPDWDGLPYSNESLVRCGFLVSIDGLSVPRPVGVRFALKVAGTASFGSLYRRSSNYEKPLSPVSDMPLKEGKKVAREAFNDLVRRRLKDERLGHSIRPRP
jgi:hypothetical protein